MRVRFSPPAPNWHNLLLRPIDEPALIVYTFSMKYFLRVTLFLFPALVLAQSLSFAETPKTIRLNDGSTIKGEITDFRNGIYTVQTPHLGTVDIDDADIQSIITENNPDSSMMPDTPSIQSPSAYLSEASPEIRQQAQLLQQKMLSDPEILMEFQNIVTDPDVMAILSDEHLMRDMMSGDPQRAQQNEKFYELMRHPKMQALMENIQQKYPVEP